MKVMIRERLRPALLVFLAVPLFVSTLPPSPAAAQSEDDGGPASRPKHDELQSEAGRRLRAYRAVALAEYLDLDEEQALEINAVISRYDERRQEARLELVRHMRVLRTAARQSEADAEEVSRAVQGVLEERARLETIRQEEARELVAKLDPVRQARLFVFFGRFPQDVRRLMREGGPPRRGSQGEEAAPPFNRRRPPRFR